MSSRRLSLQKSLTRHVTLVALVPLVIVSIFVLVHLYIETIAEIKALNLDRAHTARIQIEQYLNEPLVVLRNMSGMVRGVDDEFASKMDKMFDAHVHGSELFESIYLLSDGRKVLNVGLPAKHAPLRKDHLGLMMSHVDSCNEAIKQRRPVWSDTFQSISSGAKSLALCVPVGGRVLLGNFRIDALEKLISSENGQGPGHQITIIDSKAVVIAQNDKSLESQLIDVSGIELVQNALKGVEGTAKFNWRGNEYLGSVVILEDLGWMVMVSQSFDYAMGPLNRTAQILSGGIIAALLMSILLAWAKAKRFAEPLDALGAAAEEIAEGNYSYPVPSQKYYEMEKLGASFRSMTTAIEERQAALQASKMRLKQLANATWEALIIHDGDELIETNKPFNEITGFSIEDFSNQKFIPLIIKTDQVEAVNDHITRNRQESIEAVGLKKNGSEYPIELRVRAMELDGRDVSVTSIRDLTERKTLETHIAHAQKMEAIGTLAGGIAHDFNNILTAILGYTELCMRQESSGETKEYMNKVMIAGNRAKDLVSQILAFSRKSVEEKQPVLMQTLIKEVLGLIRKTIPVTIEIRDELEKEDIFVSGNPSQLHQVVMNLCTNAYHAMRTTGGLLRVSLESGPFKDTEDAAVPPELKAGPCVILTVADTGKGMDKAIAQRIFDPFFTTKGPGEGTGMGLALVHGIISEHRGVVTVESRPGKGATFRIFLPIMDRPTEVHTEEEEISRPCGDGHILVVDDEEAIIELETTMLEALGYRVTSKTRGQAALEAFSKNPDDFTLILTDQTMPGMTGDMLAREARKVKKNIPIIICTGYSEIVDEEKAGEMGIDAFLMKPVSMKELAKVIGNTLQCKLDHGEKAL